MLCPVRWYLFAILLVSSSAAWADESKPEANGKTYPVKLTRPSHVEEKFSVKAQGAIVRETTMSVGEGSKNVTREGYGINLEGSVEVLEMRKDGRAAKLSVTIKSCTGVTAAEPKEHQLLAPGQVLIAEGNDNGTTYTAKDGGNVSSEARAGLELVLSLEADDDDHNDDEVFGTAESQKIGAQWPINGRLAAEDARREGLDVKDEAMSGTMTLKAVEPVNGVECLKIEGTLTASSVTPPLAEKVGLPEQLKPEGGKVRYRFTVMLPTDEKEAATLETGCMISTTVHAGRLTSGGPLVRVESKTERSVQVSRMPQK